MGARYKSDQNRVLVQYESGTYGVSSGNGYWLGQVTDHSLTDSENLIESHFLGTSTRSYSDLANGPRDVEGTMTFNPQDMRLVFYTIGSVYSAGTSNKFQHTATQVNTNNWLNPFASGTGQFNAPTSFTVEDLKVSPTSNRNSLRTVNGCIPNSAIVTAAQGEKVQVELSYIGQNVVYSSGAGITTINTAVSGVTPYLWNNCTLTIAGSSIPTAKEVSVEINNNLEGPHYINGSRVIATPIVGNRDVTLNATIDWESDMAQVIYDALYKSNATFNAVFDLNADVASTGSKHTIFTFSGCKITSMELPSTSEGVTESSIEIRPQNISAQEWGVGSSYTAW